jgi:hypothetical protein
MKESYKQGLAAQFGLESCAIARKGKGEALTEVRAGRVLSCEIYASTGNRWVLRGADAVEVSGRPHRPRRYREMRQDPAQSEASRMCGNNSHGNREIPALSVERAATDRIGKSKDDRR